VVHQIALTHTQGERVCVCGKPLLKTKNTKNTHAPFCRGRRRAGRTLKIRQASQLRCGTHGAQKISLIGRRMHRRERSLRTPPVRTRTFAYAPFCRGRRRPGRSLKIRQASQLWCGTHGTRKISLIGRRMHLRERSLHTPPGHTSSCLHTRLFVEDEDALVGP
jgi:hypothetical protein